MKKVVKKAMEKAKRLEKLPNPSKDEIIHIYEQGIKDAQKLGKLLKPTWFVSDEKSMAESMRTPVFPTKKKRVSSMKKKTL